MFCLVCVLPQYGEVISNLDLNALANKLIIVVMWSDTMAVLYLVGVFHQYSAFQKKKKKKERILQCAFYMYFFTVCLQTKNK